ncbi:MAG: NADPH-dependent 2,4-dienoyl-CoA reductase [Crocinitomicaceae bacterium]|nr:NADPH-dependent 2,4-dienoyl-CoA reductase [Crocinitomicaceae bacterium]
MSRFPLLFSDIKVGNTILPNRVIMGSMHTGLEEKWGGYKKLADFYAQRARGGVGLIVTGGIAPNRAGVTVIGGSRMTNFMHVRKHKLITEAVHKEGSKIIMQILHAGRYAYTPLAVAPSAIKSPISKFKPRALSNRGIKKTIRDFVKSAKLAKKAGYNGVEVMGSEGYLINEFIAAETNKRTDEWGGSIENRIKFPIEIVSQIRKELGPDFIIMYRLSMLDLVAGGSDWNEVELLAKKIEEAGADVINTGIGWHEARIPTIATMVPRGGFAFVTKKLMGKVNIPLITTNRFNDPVDCEKALSDGCSDMISMARPFLADANIMKKSLEGETEKINTCIGCNQACLDHVFKQKIASCLVNPRACEEGVWADLDSPLKPNNINIAVVGGGPAGMSCASELALLGFSVTLYEKASELGGQFNLAKKIPGKTEFDHTIRYFSDRLKTLGVDVQLNTEVTVSMLTTQNFKHIVIASGVVPRPFIIPGSDRPEVVTYLDVLKERVQVGKNVAIIGAGGIGFDVADFITHDSDKSGFEKSWGIDSSLENRGGLNDSERVKTERNVHLLQRSPGKPGAKLGKTTGWIHRLTLRNRGVVALGGVSYKKIDDDGLHITHGDKGDVVIPVDHVIVCAGQLSFSPLAEPLVAKGMEVHLIGGAKLAKGSDAQRAIREGLELSSQLANTIVCQIP